MRHTNIYAQASKYTHALKHGISVKMAEGLKPLSQKHKCVKSGVSYPVKIPFTEK